MGAQILVATAKVCMCVCVCAHVCMKVLWGSYVQLKFSLLNFLQNFHKCSGGPTLVNHCLE